MIVIMTRRELCDQYMNIPFEDICTHQFNIQYSRISLYADVILFRDTDGRSKIFKNRSIHNVKLTRIEVDDDIIRIM